MGMDNLGRDFGRLVWTLLAALALLVLILCGLVIYIWTGGS